MKKEKAGPKNYGVISFIVFLVLITSVPLGFWKGFDNGFDFVKSSILKAAGGLFIISVSLYLSFRNSRKHFPSFAGFDRTLDPFILFLLLSVALSTIFSTNVQVSLFGNYDSQIGLITYLYFFFIYLLTPAILVDDKKFRQTFLTVETVAFVIALFSLAEQFSINPFDLRPPNFMRPVTPVGHPVFSAGFMTILLPFSAVNVSGKKSLAGRIIVPSIIFSGIIATQTRSAYLALFAQMIVISALFPYVYKTSRPEFRRFKFYSVLFLFFVCLTVLLLIIAFPENQFVKRLISVRFITRLPRWFLWKDSLEMFLHNPLTGTGIGCFSIVFENYASYELRFTEIRAFFSNAHNNFLNTFCTMGITGGLAYLLIIFQVLRTSLKNIFTAKTDTLTKIFFCSMATSFTGYIVFGIADFDDITIMLYVFVLLSLFKIKNTRSANQGSFKSTAGSRKAKLLFCAFLITFSCYGIYLAFFDIYAQKIFSESMEDYSRGNITGYIKDLNSAIEIRPDESKYRYDFAYNLFVYGSELREDSAGNKRTFLQMAKKEVNEAEKNYRSRLECLGLESLIEFELGNKEEGLKLREEIFKTDTTQFPYRTNLAVYYLKHNEDSAALYEINSILNWDIKNTHVMLLKVHYFEKNGLFAQAIRMCRAILEIEPQNKFALQTVKRLTEKNRH